MLPLALSTSWNSHRHRDGLAMLQEIRQLGFQAVELGHGIRFSLWPGVLEAHERNIIRIASLHNFCPVPASVLRPSPNCFEFTDPRPEVRAQARKATEETIRNAVRLGAGAVVLHLGRASRRGVMRRLERLYEKGQYLSRPYTALKVEAVRRRRDEFPPVWGRVLECLRPLVNLAGELGIRLGVEIREDFEEFPDEEEMAQVLEALPAGVVGYWHDFGHAQGKAFLGWHSHLETLRRRAPRLLGCHVHDCRPPREDHLPLSHGEIDFSSLLPLLPRDAIAVLELSPGVPEEQVIASRHLWNSYAAALD